MAKSRENNMDDRGLWERIKPALGKKDKSVCPDNMFLASYLEGRLSKRQTTLFEEHLFKCKVCQEAVSELRVLMQEEPLKPSEEVLKEAKKLIDAPAENGYTVVFKFPRLADLYSLKGAVRLTVSTAFILIICVAGGFYGQKTGLSRQLTTTRVISDMSFGMDYYMVDFEYL
ncbi:MAG: hypothetical protein GF375_00360 [Candidatus Omnitrophica bacterium]|nr:hypothetical protein [Candidatus Omnitrophota bacterium]MBD3268625.1 hypothetical protein [Candidatus Omnitrophota bacterium]